MFFSLLTEKKPNPNCVPPVVVIQVASLACWVDNRQFISARSHRGANQPRENVVGGMSTEVHVHEVYVAVCV